MKITNIIFIIFLVLVDQASKFLIRHKFALYESMRLTSFLSITYTTNTGIAFGVLEGMNWAFIIITSLVLVYIIRNFDTLKKDFGKVGISAFILIISGGIGNLIDRVFLGKVVDFIDLRFNNKNIWPIFNFADSYVFIGVSLLILFSFLKNPVKFFRYKKQ